MWAVEIRFFDDSGSEWSRLPGKYKSKDRAYYAAERIQGRNLMEGAECETRVVPANLKTGASHA